MAEPMTHNGRSWRQVEAAAFVAVGITTFATLLFNTDEIPIVLIIGGVYVALGGAVLRWIGRPRVALAAAALGLLVEVGGVPFVLEDLSHIESWGSFAPTAVRVVAALVAIAAGFISFFAPAISGSRRVAVAAVALSVVLVVASVGASISAGSDAAQATDVVVLAEGIEYPKVLTASEGLIGFHVTNEDPIRHTFVIDGTSVKLEVPASKQRRVEVELAAGEYRFFCDVPGHERMEGILTVR